MRLFWLLLGSVAFWSAVLFLGGLVMILQGDCWAGTIEAEARMCGHHASTLGFAVVAAGAIVYATVVWRYFRNRRG